MQKPCLLGTKSLDQLRFIRGPTVGPAKSMPLVNSRPSTDSISLGVFANLKLTAEKLVKEQASVKTDLELANSKLKKSAEQIHLLEVKLQEAINENAKLKVKHKEDAKLWNGLDSKLSSTKMLCDQLTETLQHLVCRTQDAEKDKKFLEEKLLESSKAFVGLGCQLNDLSVKFDNAEKTIINGKEEVTKVENEKKEIENHFKEQCCVSSSLMKERDAIVKQLKDTVEADKVHLQSLISQVEELRHGLESKEATSKDLRSAIDNLEEERNSLQSSNEDFSRQLIILSNKAKSLEDAFYGFLTKADELDKHSFTVANNIVRLFSSFETFQRLIQQEKDLVVKNAEKKFDSLHGQFQILNSENDSLKLEIESLKNKNVELEKAQELLMVQHAEECHLMEDKVRRLELEIHSLASKKSELELLVNELEEKNSHLSEVHTLADSQLQELLLKASKLESENQDAKNKMQLRLMEKSEEINTLQNETVKHRQHITSLESQIIELRSVLDEKEQCNLQFCEREKLLEEQKSEIQASLTSVECRLTEARKQYDLMLETKQLELSKHLKEISQKNDQAINDIRKKYEMEKLEIVNIEKEKADKLVKDTERTCAEKLAECKEEAQQQLVHIQEEHEAFKNQINQEFGRKESKLRSSHNEDLQRVQLLAENEAREKISHMRKEHEIQMQILRHQHDDECRKLQEELDLLKSKEEKQRTLLQLQWKVMDEKSQQNDVEVSSKKVTHHEYEIETSNGRTITKRRKTKSTVMFEDPSTHKRVKVKAPKAVEVVKKLSKVHKGAHLQPSNIGDLFSEGSLNPYTDDPYAFD